MKITNSQFSECIACTPVAVYSFSETNVFVLEPVDQFSSKILSTKQNSSLINLNKKNYAEKFIFFPEKTR